MIIKLGKNSIRPAVMEACTLWPMAGKPVTSWCECHLGSQWNLSETLVFFEFPKLQTASHEVSTLLTVFFQKKLILPSMKWEDFRIGNLEFFSQVWKKVAAFFWKVWSSHHFFSDSSNQMGYFQNLPVLPWIFVWKTRLGWQICWMGILDPSLVASLGLGPWKISPKIISGIPQSFGILCTCLGRTCR